MPVVLPADGPRGRRPRRSAVRAVASTLTVALLAALPVTAAGAAGPPASVADEPSSLSVRTAGDLRVSGKVRPAAARPVRVERRVGDSWVTVATTRSNAGGRFSAEVPTTLFVGRSQLRTLLPAAGGAPEAVGDATTVTIRAQGKASSRSLLIPGKEAHRWDPCRTIDFRVNLRQAPPGTLGEVRGALRRVTAQSGLQFRYAGATGVVPGTRKGKYPPGTDLVLAWIRPGQSSHFPRGSGAAGFGGAYGSLTLDGNDRAVPTLSDGFVLIESGVYEKLDPGFGAGKPYGYSGTRGQLLMHEIGHAVGMGHADRDRGQVMYPVMQDAPAVWGRGDAANLERLGLAAGCIAGPENARATARRPGTPRVLAYLP